MSVAIGSRRLSYRSLSGPDRLISTIRGKASGAEGEQRQVMGASFKDFIDFKENVKYGIKS